jgi:hypothetical protein
MSRASPGYPAQSRPKVEIPAVSVRFRPSLRIESASARSLAIRAIRAATQTLALLPRKPTIASAGVHNASTWIHRRFVTLKNRARQKEKTV